MKIIFIDRIEWRNDDDTKVLHRLEGPAIEWSDGGKEWWIYGKRHRENGPAIEYSDGNRYWYQNGKYHRLDGPAVENSNGSTWWYQNDYLHRLDGPAVELSNGSVSWYIKGKQYLEQEWFEVLDEEDKISYLFNISG